MRQLKLSRDYIQEKKMKVKDLVALLEKCDQEQEAFVWDNGSRYPIVLVDELDDCVDVMFEKSERV